MRGPAGREILLTGATGFVGKVALEAILRRRDELGVDRVHVLIRPRAGRSARERFEAEVAPSTCFARLGAGWSEHVEAVDGDITAAGCGLGDETRERLVARITHILHLAASVEFDLPLADALEVNTQGGLHVLELAREAPRLERLVMVSTAYVTPHPGDGVPVRETLAPLPRPAGEIREAILAGHVDEAELLRETRHPNTYTLTKCLGEHLCVERRGTVPLSIVRPSIVSPSWREPFPGWIDSPAAFAVFVALGGAGYMRVVAARPDTKLDLVPVDVVAERVLHAAFDSASPAAEAVPIHHAVAGLARSPTTLQCRDHILDFFRRHPVDRWPHLAHLGPAGPRFALAEGFHHVLRVHVGALLLGRRWRKAARLRERLRRVNRTFAYFTHQTFDFVSDSPPVAPDLEPATYLDTICAGVHRHLLRGDDSDVPLAGRRGPARGGDLRFVLRQPRGSTAIRLSAWVVTKALRRAADLVSVDLASFERARQDVPQDAGLVLAPSHRSYLDFVLCAYLCFARPDLGIPVPHTAAASDFSRIPVLGRLFKSLNAFYVERGLGREDEALTEQVHALVRERKTIEFFIEGTRSRSRRFLEPKRGFLRALQTTGDRFALLPIAFSYERVPEETSFSVELAGADRPPMRLSALLGWTWRLLRGRVRLGRIHVAAGAPVLLDSSRDVADVGRDVVGELQRATVVTTLHLRALLAREPLRGLDVTALAEAIRLRGGRVLKSALDAETVVQLGLAGSLRHQLEHLFYPEARAALAAHPVVADLLARHDFVRGTPSAATLADPLGPVLMQAVFEPVCRDYERVADALGDPGRGPAVESPRELVRREPECELPNVEAAFDDLVRRGILARAGATWTWGPRAGDLARWREQCTWPGEPSATPVGESRSFARAREGKRVTGAAGAARDDCP